MEEAIVDHLLAQPALRAMVGDRITWKRRQQGAALPAIVLHVVDSIPSYTMRGPTSLTSARIQVDVWAASYATAKMVARAVIAALSGARFGAFQGSFQESAQDRVDQGGGDVEVEFVEGVSLDFTIWHNVAMVAPLIGLSNTIVFHAAEAGDVVGAAFMEGAFIGAPFWFLTDDAGGKYKIDPNTGEVTVAAALTAGADEITVAAFTTPSPEPRTFTITVFDESDLILHSIWIGDTQ